MALYLIRTCLHYTSYGQGHTVYGCNNYTKYGCHHLHILRIWFCTWYGRVCITHLTDMHILCTDVIITQYTDVITYTWYGFLVVPDTDLMSLHILWTCVHSLRIWQLYSIQVSTMYVVQTSSCVCYGHHHTIHLTDMYIQCTDVITE